MRYETAIATLLGGGLGFGSAAANLPSTALGYAISLIPAAYGAFAGYRLARGAFRPERD